MSCQKINAKWNTDLNRKLKVIKLLEENLRKCIHSFIIGKEFLEVTENTNHKKS